NGRNIVKNETQIKEEIKKIIKLGERKGKKVVDIRNEHYIEAHENMYRRILIASQKGNPLNRVHLPDTPYRTTSDMLEQFSFLDDDTAYEIVVENSNAIAEKVEPIAPLKNDLYTPSIEGAEEEIK